MNEILINAMTVLVLLAGLAATVAWARKDVFAGPGVGHRPADPIGPGTDPDLPQRTLNRATDEVRPAPYELHSTTATA
ncbi:hypothetical protein EFK50_02770 [Nocardioides marmoriginsengisoli]|uniref:Uncharacterized protein n=1 Tax=Nocardioides marmoriginsengisoli TaxID=661483 RepID=A0A3N0CN81_9ACTN|nr:hypothetical protein [Nocardioides marmoriginsengisoli]RNL64922.1 hypothetical protein EFK50_02770 [Nocardioides marmoriginsengisoli]